MSRFLGILFGIVTHAALLGTLWPLYSFLRNDLAASPEGPLWIDAAAALQFAIPHSLLLLPATRRWITRFLPSELYGLLFCLATCLGLWITFAMWRGSGVIVWSWPEFLRPAIQAGFLGSWLALIYSLKLTGFGYQTGFHSWWCWVRRRPLPRRTFQVSGAYRWLRHPAYFSFLGLVWMTPVVTADRAILIAVWTSYVFVGSYLKDMRMLGILGEPYRRYMAHVPGFPFIPWGPLGRPRFFPPPAAHDSPIEPYGLPVEKPSAIAASVGRAA